MADLFKIKIIKADDELDNLDDLIGDEVSSFGMFNNVGTTRKDFNSILENSKQIQQATYDNLMVVCNRVINNAQPIFNKMLGAAIAGTHRTMAGLAMFPKKGPKPPPPPPFEREFSEGEVMTYKQMIERTNDLANKTKGTLLNRKYEAINGVRLPGEESSIERHTVEGVARDLSKGKEMTQAMKNYINDVLRQKQSNQTSIPLNEAIRRRKQYGLSDEFMKD